MEQSQLYQVALEESISEGELRLQFGDESPKPKRRRTLAVLGRGKGAAQQGKSGIDDLKKEINMV